MSTPFISRRTHQFTYFDRQLGHPEWRGKHVLDFGGNAGNILRGRENKIEPSRYWSIDLSREAIALGQKLHPEAHLVFYDRYSIEFNPTGVMGLPIPDPGVRFDIALAFSVFTHTSKAEMIELVGQMYDLLVPGGMLAFTFLDPNWTVPADWEPHPMAGTGATNLEWGLRRRIDVNPAVDVQGLLTRAATEPRLTWVTFVNNEDLYLNPNEDGIGGDESKPYLTFSTTDYMQELYPDARILDPISPEQQHCAVLRKPDSSG
ncbi:MAG: class I SAM-dependent methyltransferase [Streptomycetales bacterium]